MIRYIIPARKGSKSYPFKNRRLLSYTLNTIPKKERKGQQIQHIASLTEAGKNAEVSPDESKILDLCDGRTSINEISKNVDLPYFEIMKEILYFKRMGLLTVRKALA